MPHLIDEIRELARDWRWFRRPLPPASVADAAAPVTHWRFPTRWARSRAAAALRNLLQVGALRPVLHSQLRIEVDGRERVGELGDGPLILAANHASHLDAPLVLTSLPAEVRRRTVTLAASDYFFDAWWRAAATGLVFNAAPVDRTLGGRDALPSDLLGEGFNVLIFPEGTRSRDGYAGRFRHGAAHLAFEAGAPIVPIAIQGSWRAMPKGRGWPVRGRPRVQVAFGPPLAPEGQVAGLTRRLETEIARLRDQQRTDWWTSMRNAERGATPSLRGPDIAGWRRRWALLQPDAADEDERIWTRRREAS